VIRGLTSRSAATHRLSARRFVVEVVGGFGIARCQVMFGLLIDFFVSLRKVALGHFAVALVDAVRACKPGAAPTHEAYVFPSDAKSVKPTPTLVFTEVEPFASSLAFAAFDAFASISRLGDVAAAVGNLEGQGKTLV
jgi:hypothetical protein